MCSRDHPGTRVQASPTEAEKFFKQGVALGEAAKWDEAAVSLRAAVMPDPTYNAWCYLGLAEDKNAGKYCEASLEPHMRCFQRTPTDIGAHINLAGVLLHVRRDVDGAERLLRSALELDPGSPNAHGHLSELLEQERGDLDGAIAEMEGFLRFGGIPGFDGEAKLVWLKEKKTKADGEAKLASLKEKAKTNHNEVRAYLVSLRDNKAKAHHADVRRSCHRAPSPHVQGCFVSFRFVLLCFVSFIRSSSCPGSCRCFRRGGSPICAGISRRGRKSVQEGGRARR